MLCDRALLLSVLFAHLPLAISQTCVWKDGTTATDYVPCRTGATSGTCCHAGEACLASGLCYGAPGLIYRGACVDSWDTPDCLTYCKESLPYWANIYPCNEGLGADNPSRFWCGSPTLKTCSVDEGKLFKVSPGVAVKLIPRVSTTVASSAQTSSPRCSLPTSTSASSKVAARNPDGVASSDKTTCSGATEAEKIHFANSVTAVGAGVGVPFGVLALAFLGLFLNERRLRKKLTKPTDVSGPGVAYGPVNSTYQGPDYGQGQVPVRGQEQEQVQYVYKPENEMPANSDPAHELTGGHHRPVHELGGQNYPL
ncbi:hypothetical protein V499_01804 [Pseudogymnoascus sp. VKM F-103]|uniref:Mid2 domain-containing protein n=1 Tax=Pseudogymnoascus verrucosus TaxID=342668 RepID=A0A1B8GM28_9PEZI|nr:uncharacterized protein VE01_05579 [Pseudogymnoascus verrucosus]KFY79171.1 hypothetical protein V499_01804 [Pseudogymnoascus sp. VKM F-103]OBT96877.1 hypothetical protein VE01_05579 [Pseudogymnoascus verrucosus]